MMWKKALDCIQGFDGDWGTRSLLALFLRCLTLVIIQGEISDPGQEIVKIYDYKPAWIARYEGMRVWFSHVC